MRGRSVEGKAVGRMGNREGGGVQRMGVGWEEEVGGSSWGYVQKCGGCKVYINQATQYLLFRILQEITKTFQLQNFNM